MGGESLGSQWTSIVLQEWESDQSWMVMDMGSGESEFFTYFPDVINYGPLIRTLSSIAILNFFSSHVVYHFDKKNFSTVLDFENTESLFKLLLAL